MSAAADAAAVLADPGQFEALVGQLLQADNVARKHAEAVFEEVKKHADGCVSHLLRCLRTSPSEENRAFSAIMLRKVLTRDEPTMFEASSPQVQVRGPGGGRRRRRRRRRPLAAAAPSSRRAGDVAAGRARRAGAAPPGRGPRPRARSALLWGAPGARGPRSPGAPRPTSPNLPVIALLPPPPMGHAPAPTPPPAPPLTAHLPSSPNLPPPAQATVKQELLAALTAEPNASVRKKVGDTVSELAADLLSKEQWPEVLPALVERIQSGQPQVRARRAGRAAGTGCGWSPNMAMPTGRIAPSPPSTRLITPLPVPPPPHSRPARPQAMEGALTILATLATYSTDSLRPHLAQLHPILGTCLGHPSLEVQVRSCRGAGAAGTRD
jgi:hypothetical protein